MDISHILDPLNKAQRAAVAAPSGPSLVLAGAGSGKTRVLTHRIAYLVRGHGISPHMILGTTFTNKAAREMRGRIETLLQAPFHGMWLGTFHGLCHRILRLHPEAAGLPENFEIVDSDDQLRLIRRVLKNLDLDEKDWPPRQMQWMINQHKDASRRSARLPSGHGGIWEKMLHRVYADYEEVCQKSGLVDFAEILLRTLELFQNNQAIRETYQQRFQHILVDEFQDTNSVQYQWLQALSARHRNLFVVGDDDQSIYGWRGAKVENILSFEKDFPGANVLRLEQNYRSTGTILTAANAVIAHNSGRLGKNLWTKGSEGSPIRLYEASTGDDEARFVVEQLRSWIRQGHRRDEAAVLYRSNAQSRVFEQELVRQDIPYRVYGGLRFYERAEIKNALAYLRLLSNRDSNHSFERVVNLPARGIGDKTMGIILEHARLKQVSMWQAGAELIAERGISPRALAALSGFQNLIMQMAEDTAGLGLGELTGHVLKQSGLFAHHKNERGELARGRVENLQELVSAAENFVPDENETQDDLSAFLDNAALQAGEGQSEEWEDCVQLMSLHSAKGLEFPLVFICGMEEGRFPNQKSLEEGSLEEERRLCYVGMTRAMQQLVMSRARRRWQYGQSHANPASRFLAEIPGEYVEKIRSPGWDGAESGEVLFRGGTPPQTAGFDGIRLGHQVRHRKFGAGTVVGMEGQGIHARVQVHFADAGMKWLICSYANLEPI
ncbi:MAG: DNA helicase II [Gammaproteobacteria bacterium]|nr:DNA helicase II [Gammaproteobacteria bacterium]